MFHDTNINKLLLKRLFALWFVASVIVGGIVSYIEIEAVDDQVVELGLKQAYTIDPLLIERLPLNDMNDVVALQNIVNRMTDEKFVIAEVYNNDLAHLAVSVRVGNKRISDKVDEKQHQFPLDKELHYEKFNFDEVMYIQILVPLIHNDTVNGY